MRPVVPLILVGLGALFLLGGGNGEEEEVITPPDPDEDDPTMDEDRLRDLLKKRTGEVTIPDELPEVIPDDQERIEIGVIKGLEDIVDDSEQPPPQPVPNELLTALDYTSEPRTNRYYQARQGDTMIGIIATALGVNRAHPAISQYAEAMKNSFWNFALYGARLDTSDSMLTCGLYPRHLAAERFLRSGVLPDRVVGEEDCSKVAGVTGNNSYALYWLPGINQEIFANNGQLVITVPEFPLLTAMIETWPMVRSV